MRSVSNATPFPGPLTVEHPLHRIQLIPLVDDVGGLLRCWNWNATPGPGHRNTFCYCKDLLPLFTCYGVPNNPAGILRISW